MVNASLGLHTTVELSQGHSDCRVEAPELGQSLTATSTDDLPTDGDLALAAAALRTMLPGARVHLRIHSAAPVGSGLGGSGTLGVALVQGAAALAGRRMTPGEVAELAYRIESEGAGNPGGRQDQYAAALGGVNHLGFREDRVAVRALTTPEGFLEKLARHLVVCYLGESRVSGSTIARVMDSYRNRCGGVAEALLKMVQIADDMAVAVAAGNLDLIAELMNLNWECQMALDGAMQTPAMAALEAAMRGAGAVGVKAVGSGAGGSMAFLALADAAPLHDVARTCGAVPLPVTLGVPGAAPC